MESGEKNRISQFGACEGEELFSSSMTVHVLLLLLLQNMFFGVEPASFLFHLRCVCWLSLTLYLYIPQIGSIVLNFFYGTIYISIHACLVTFIFSLLSAVKGKKKEQNLDIIALC